MKCKEYILNDQWENEERNRRSEIIPKRKLKGQQQPNEMKVEDANLRSVKKKIDVEGNGQENNLPHVSLPLTYGTHECGYTTSYR
ncbi:unnamed protein product [Brugia pahangi]|uniref:Uncharacterized protein n=1 Tax=Brugia pahangi TaxID=6280 RepID=A0A0N4TL37_BRUPA|nr:unnamed protein product [Brugia pahangi]